MILFGVLGDLESPENWLNKGHLIFEEHLGREVGSDDDLLMLEIYHTSFCLAGTSVLVCPDLKVMAEDRCIQVFENDNFLT